MGLVVWTSPLFPSINMGLNLGPAPSISMPSVKKPKKEKGKKKKHKKEQVPGPSGFIHL